jgi:hypothetical protein
MWIKYINNYYYSVIGNDRCVTDRKIDLERDQDPCRLVIQLEYEYFLPILSINDFSLVAHL